LEDRALLDRHYLRIHGRPFIPGWLDDAIIDAYISIMLEKNSQFFGFRSSEVDCFCRDRPGLQQSRNAKTKLPKTVEFLLLPYNSCSHWSLLVLDIKQNVFLHLDSLGYAPPDGKKLESLKQSIWAYWGVECLKAEASSIPCSRQKDSKSCGIHLLHNAELFVHGEIDKFIIDCDTVKYRLKVFKAVVSHPDNTTHDAK
jgi:hypothetical protein